MKATQMHSVSDQMQPKLAGWDMNKKIELTRSVGTKFGGTRALCRNNSPALFLREAGLTFRLLLMPIADPLSDELSFFCTPPLLNRTRAAA